MPLHRSIITITLGETCNDSSYTPTLSLIIMWRSQMVNSAGLAGVLNNKTNQSINQQLLIAVDYECNFIITIL